MRFSCNWISNTVVQITRKFVGLRIRNSTPFRKDGLLRGVPDMRMHQRNGIKCLDVFLIPLTDTAIQMYTCNGGHLTMEAILGLIH